MKLIDPEHLSLSASDLVGHLACHHLTAQNYAAERSEIDPPPWSNPVLEAIQERGREHEKLYLEHLRNLDLELFQGSAPAMSEAAAAETAAAMRDGAPVIVQAQLESEGWIGIADVLLRVDEPSQLGSWSYEVVDTKLARETSGGTILQLCLYSELVGEIQGELPRQMHVVAPGRGFEPASYRVLDYLAYYRLIKRRLKQFTAASLQGSAPYTYPDPVSHCDVCRWRPVCRKRREADDHLSLVAGISKLQIKEFKSKGIDRLETLGRLESPLGWKPDRGSVESYERIKEQARVQLRSREEKRPVHELLPREADRGLARLPEPSAQDVFFDIEGDPFAGDGGREYLFGYAFQAPDGTPEYRSTWALAGDEERRMFEGFIAEMMDRWEQDSGFHIYHYAPYETSALKRLMGRYGVCEDDIDRMLRAGVFVDLYSVARQAVLAGVESYSIKKLEPLFGFEREEDLKSVRENLSAVERALELGETESLPEHVLNAVETYNRDDCVATLRLRDWLESLRTGLVEAGEPVERPGAESGEPSDKLKERKLQIEELASKLLREVPEDRESWDSKDSARWQLANLLEWHWREEKVAWWEYHRLAALDSGDLQDERTGIAELAFQGEFGGTPKCPIHRYSYPFQELKLKEGVSLHQGEVKVGTVEGFDLKAQWVDIKRTSKSAHFHPEAVFAHDVIFSTALSGSLFRLGEWLAENDPDAEGSYRAARDLLLAAQPRFREGASGLFSQPGETTLAQAQRLGLELADGTLPIQGPPGSGKTFSAARMICSLVAANKKVGITANSHKVIRNLLQEVVKAAKERGLPLRSVQKVKTLSETPTAEIIEVLKNADVLSCLETGQAQVAGGTAWLWAPEGAFESVDVMFVDEAGQMSLANALAVAQAGRSLVLLGDPQQLEQPRKGSHPDGTDISALDHLLAGKPTIPDDRGLFLPETWRLHPSLCKFTSEAFYEGRLASRPEMETQNLRGTEPISEPGLWFVPVEHEGNQSSAPDEVDAIGDLVTRLTQRGSSWTDQLGRERQLELRDILIVAPYNAQVALLSVRLGDQARVGTVDKFQGQQAPVVIYSMTTSSPEDAPRGMEFLYSLNRLNVATSRARCACILVGSPRLFEPDCRSPRQMELANALCRYLELARTIIWPIEA